MIMNAGFLVLAGLSAMEAALLVDNPPGPFDPVSARAHVGKEIALRMTVAVAKDRLEKWGEIYLDSELEFKSPKNFAVVITRKGAASLKAAGVENPADHYRGKTITAKGVVNEVEGVPRIEIEAANRISVVRK